MKIHFLKHQPYQRGITISLLLAWSLGGALLETCVWAARKPEPVSGWRAFNEKRYDDAWTEAQTILSQKPKHEDANWLAAEVALAQGDTTTSLQYWYTVLEANNAHPEAVLKSVDLLIERNDLDRAQGIVDAALIKAKKKELPEYLYCQGILLNCHGKEEEAKVYLYQAIDKNPEEPLFYIALAHIYKQRKVLALAKDNYLKAIALDSTNASVHYELAVIYQEIKQYSEALAELKITRSLDPNYPDVYYRIGKLYFYAEKYEQAVQELEASLQNGKKENFFFNTIYGQALRANKRLEDAQVQLEKAYQAKPTDLANARVLATNSFDLKNYSRSIEVFRQIISTPEAEPNDYSRLGEAYYRMAGKEAAARPFYDSAAVYLKVAYTLNQQSTRLLYLIGLTHFSADQYDSAIVYLNQKVQVDTTDLPSCINLGYSYLKLERYQEAIRVFRRALQLDSARVSVHMMLANTLTFVDSIKAAKQEFRSIIQMDTTQGDAYGGLGFILLREESWRAAANYLSRATSLVPDNANYWVAYGQASYYLEDYETAGRAFRQALKYSPGNNNNDAQNGLDAIAKVKTKKGR